MQLYLSLFEHVVVLVDPRTLPLKFGQNQVNNSIRNIVVVIVVIVSIVAVVVVVHIVVFILLIPETYL